MLIPDEQAALDASLGRDLASALTPQQGHEILAAIHAHPAGVERVAQNVAHQSQQGVIAKPVAVLLARIRRGDHHQNARTIQAPSRPIQTTVNEEPERREDSMPLPEFVERCRELAAGIRRGQVPT